MLKFSRLAEQTGELHTKYTVNYFRTQIEAQLYTFNVISKTHIAVILCESTISCMLVCQPAQVAC